MLIFISICAVYNLILVFIFIKFIITMCNNNDIMNNRLNFLAH